MPVKFTNNASATLASSINGTATTIALTSGQGALFPSLGASEFFYGTLSDSSNNLEIVKVTARSTDSLTVVRGQDGTSARSYTAGDRFELRPVAAALDAKFDKDGGTVTGNLAVTGNVTIDGNTTLGNASGDSVTFNAAAVTLTNATAVTGTWSNLGAVTTVDINGGTIDGATIGSASAAAATFTTLNATGDVTFSSTGYLDLPTGTTAQRPGSPSSGMIRFNSSLTQFEGYNGTAWGAIGGAGATGGGTDKAFYENDQTITTNYTLTAGKNAGTFGTVTVNSGITVTVPSGSTWTVV